MGKADLTQDRLIKIKELDSHVLDTVESITACAFCFRWFQEVYIHEVTLKRRYLVGRCKSPNGGGFP